MKGDERVIQKIFGDHEFLILFESKENEDGGYIWINYSVYEIPCVEIIGETEKDQFNRIGYTGSGEYVDTLDQAEVFIEGWLKWDGCTEFEIKDSAHFCGRKDAHKMTRIIDAIYDTAISHFNFSPEDTK